ncbi:hypothetical protein FRB90_002754 [Tulasnella sp. 427]|nr:hypothetical protein FRB90_002754 [Tulasnella sp. 427]
MNGYDSNLDLLLTWEFDPDEMRKVEIFMTHPKTKEKIMLYRFATFERLTTYYRFNLITGRNENAGNIEWNSLRNVRLNMGLRELSIDQMAWKNKANSRSRRFKALNNVDYKWRPVETEPANLECVTVSGKKFVALYNAAEQTLLVNPRGHFILDDIVVLCLVHLWRRANNWDFQLPETAEGSSAAQ